MSLETIRSMSRDAGIEAAENAVSPKFFWDTDIDDLKAGDLEGLKAIPNLGDHVPDGYEFVKNHFVDSSGFGEEGEAALTIGQFIDQMTPDNGYAIVSAGQFQINISEFKRI